MMRCSSQMLVFYSDFDYFKTDERKQSNAGAIAGSVIVVIILLAASVVAVVLVCLYFR